MTNGGWQIQRPSQQPHQPGHARHGRHRQGSSGAAWTPSVRPRESGHTPSHARPDPVPGRMRPGLAPAPPPAWPTTNPEPVWPDLGAPPMSSLPTAPLSLTRIREEREKQRRDEPVVHVLPPETPPRGLRKFDLGTVPASVTPPRTWRKAAWFAVGTSAAVMVGLAYAAVEFVGKPGEPPMIDALPAYPTRPWTLQQLPAEQTTSSSEQPLSSTGRPKESSSAHNPDTSIGDSPVETTDAPGGPPTTSPGGGSTVTPVPTEPATPNRTTVGPAPVTPTNPQKMGDVTEAYYATVTDDPAAAHEMTTGSMAREGAEGIEARYQGVERVEVQEITIDREKAITTSTVKLVHEDGTETIEQRQLEFTWGGDPKIIAEATTA